MSKKFHKTIEDFVCEHCGASVKGNGFTNHCPRCLWSKHVDVFPGDRLERCGGLMEPVRADKEGGKDYVIHKCVKCGVEKRNQVSRDDNFDTLLKIAESFAKKVNKIS